MSTEFWGKALPVLAILAVGCSSGGNGSDAGTPSSDSGPVVADGGPSDGGSSESQFVDQANHSFTDAKAIQVDRDIITAKLPSATTGGDYYSFHGTAGDTLLLIAYAQILDENGTGSDPSRLDTVVTLYDSNHNQIAQDDDAWPRFASDSELFIMVPATGTYYFSVQDCHAAGLGNCGTSTPSVTNFDYETAVLHVGRLTVPEIYAGTQQNGTTDHAVTLTYAVPSSAPDAGNGKNDYGRYIIDGRFSAVGATHVFSFTPPADTDVDTTAPVTAEFWVQPAGTHNGDGSTADVLMWVTDSSGTNVIAKVDQNNYGDGDNMTNGALDMSVPVTLGSQYYLFVQNTAADSNPATDYYFIGHSEGNASGDTLDAEPNNSIGSAQVLTAGSNGVFGAAGTLTSGDEDWYQVDAPSGSTKVTIACGGQRSGSGLRGLTFGLYTSNSGSPSLVTGTEATEAADTDFSVSGVTLPSGTHFFLKVSATGQDPDVSGNYYGCGVSYSP